MTAAVHARSRGSDRGEGSKGSDGGSAMVQGMAVAPAGGSGLPPAAPACTPALR